MLQFDAIICYSSGTMTAVAQQQWHNDSSGTTAVTQCQQWVWLVGPELFFAYPVYLKFDMCFRGGRRTKVCEFSADPA